MRSSSRLRLFAAFVLCCPGFAAAQAEEEEVVDPAGGEPAYADEEYVEEEPVEEEPGEEATPSTSAATPGSSDAPRRRRRWLAPEPTFTLHGYMRVRGEWQDHFALGRVADETTSGNAGQYLPGYPFRYFLPVDRDVTATGGCSRAGGPDTGCFRGSDRLRYGNMRMRLEPTVSLSDDVRVHATLDVFDNLVLGSTPDASAYGAYYGSSSGVSSLPAGVPLDFFTRTLNPAVAGRNSPGNSIYVRRAWAEVGNRDLGEIRFGRMANHWGLGMLWNGGAGIDSDYSTDVDRVMISRQLFGFTLGAAWDFVDEGAIIAPGNLNGLAYDGSNRDDVKQFSFFAAHTLTPEEEAERLERGSAVFVGGLYYQYRSQDFSYLPFGAPSTPAGVASTTGVLGSTFRPYDPSGYRDTYLRRDATSHSLDMWGRFRWKDLRVELEAALVVGHIRNTQATTFTNENLRLLQFGFALEGEYRLLERKLGIFLNTGLATGDRDVNGISIRENTLTQDATSNDGRATQFTFHPNYRIDLILFRNILGSVGGAYYLRPGISYDIIHNTAGRLLGVRADFIYSRAVSATQVYGSSQNLGIEMDASIYYRSEDGPDVLDGYWIAFNYGILFPLAGLGYREGELTNPPKIGKAQTLRVVLGVQF